MKTFTFKMIITLSLLAFAITLAIVIGQRMSSEAMAVLMGVVAGVAASIPTSLIVVWIAAKFMLKPNEPAPVEPPRVVVMQQPAPAPQSAPAYGYPTPQPGYGWGGGPAYPAVAAPPMPRRFTVIGGAGNLEESSLQSLEVE
ncbi:MAG: hypothetical protein HYZ49_19540 [Chloroflexi bacterium]|nr:hypothetical protein [Chloroflexota bacterium]